MNKMREAFKQLQINERRRTFAECEYWLNQYKLFAEQVLQALAAEPEPAGEPVAVEFIADLQRSRSKHPGIKKMFDGLLGEVHELKRAYQGDGDVRAEAFDVAVCAYRIATEGDEGENQKIDFVPDWMAWGATNPTPEAVRKLVDIVQRIQMSDQGYAPGPTGDEIEAALAEVRAMGVQP